MVALSAPAPAQASGHVAGPFDSGTAIAIAVPLALLPGEIGSLTTGNGADFEAAFVDPRHGAACGPTGGGRWTDHAFR